MDFDNIDWNDPDHVTARLSMGDLRELARRAGLDVPSAPGPEPQEPSEETD